MGAGGSRDPGLMTEINVTPLVDVVLVLLVLMMMTATALASRTIPVSLPEARSGSSDAPRKPLVVGIDEHGALYLDKQRATDPEVRAACRAAHERDAQAASAILAADGRARHESVVHALDLIRSERLAKIAIVVRTEGP